jgi:hypothetical protein
VIHRRDEAVAQVLRQRPPADRGVVVALPVVANLAPGVDAARLPVAAEAFHHGRDRFRHEAVREGAQFDGVFTLVVARRDVAVARVHF